MPRRRYGVHCWPKIYYKKQLDVKYIIGKLNTVDKLSYLFFGNNYINLLEKASNPYIKSDISIKNEILLDTDAIMNHVSKNFKDLINI